MRLHVNKLDLLWDGELPRDSMAGGKHRELFCRAQPLLEYEFKVERPAFVRVWWFDRVISRVLNPLVIGGRPVVGKHYPIESLLSDTDYGVACYLEELGWQVKVGVKSIDRLEYATLTVFSPRGAILQANEAYSLRSLFEEEPHPERESTPGYAVVHS